MKALLAVVAAAGLVGCGSGSTSGGLERGDGAAVKAPTVKVASAKPTPKPAAGNAAMAMVRKHSPKPGLVVRWPSKVIAVDSTERFVLDGLAMLAGTGIRFVPGRGGGIKFMGYSTARDSVGWSRYNYRNGRITHCEIWLNPRYLKRYSAAKTFAHETVHCLGMNGHTPHGLMDRFGRGTLTQATRNWLITLYSLKPGTRV